jgi:hypothetical protein
MQHRFRRVQRHPAHWNSSASIQLPAPRTSLHLVSDIHGKEALPVMVVHEYEFRACSPAGRDLRAPHGARVSKLLKNWHSLCGQQIGPCRRPESGQRQGPGRSRFSDRNQSCSYVSHRIERAVRALVPKGSWTEPPAPPKHGTSNIQHRTSNAEGCRCPGPLRSHRQSGRQSVRQSARQSARQRRPTKAADKVVWWPVLIRGEAGLHTPVCKIKEKMMKIPKGKQQFRPHPQGQGGD